MIKIGETHVVCPTLGNAGSVPARPEATKAVKRLVEAARTVCEASDDDDRYVAIIRLDDALAPFMEDSNG
jgi:hypothetical protein